MPRHAHAPAPAPPSKFPLSPTGLPFCPPRREAASILLYSDGDIINIDRRLGHANLSILCKSHHPSLGVVDPPQGKATQGKNWPVTSLLEPPTQPAPRLNSQPAPDTSIPPTPRFASSRLALATPINLVVVPITGL